MAMLEPNGEWLAPLDEASGLALLVIAYASHFDFHVLSGSENRIASIYGSDLQVHVREVEAVYRLEVGNALLELPSRDFALMLADKVAVRVEHG